VNTGLPAATYTPPPHQEVTLRLKLILVNVGLLRRMNIPAPEPALLALKVRLARVRVLLEMVSPPPRSSGSLPLALPPVMVKPSRMVVGSVLLLVTTW